MDLDALLLTVEEGVLDEAYSALQRSQVTHYELAGEALTRQRLAELFHLVVGFTMAATRSRVEAGPLTSARWPGGPVTLRLSRGSGRRRASRSSRSRAGRP